MLIKVAMKLKMRFICPQDVEEPNGILLDFEEYTPRKYFPGTVTAVKVHGKIAICMSTNEGFYEEYYISTMVLNPKIWRHYEHC